MILIWAFSEHIKFDTLDIIIHIFISYYLIYPADRTDHKHPFFSRIHHFSLRFIFEDIVSILHCNNEPALLIREQLLGVFE